MYNTTFEDGWPAEQRQSHPTWARPGEPVGAEARMDGWMDGWIDRPDISAPLLYTPASVSHDAASPEGASFLGDQHSSLSVCAGGPGPAAYDRKQEYL